MDILYMLAKTWLPQLLVCSFLSVYDYLLQTLLGLKLVPRQWWLKPGSVTKLMIQSMTWLGNFGHCKADFTKSHLILSNALFRSNFNHILILPLGRWKFFSRSRERRVFSAIDLPRTSAVWLWLMILDIIGFILQAIILAMIL